MLYSIDGTVVFGRVVTVPTEDGHTFLDILGRTMTAGEAAIAVNDIANRDRSVVDAPSQVVRNMELGQRIIALWREYVIGVGLGGQSIAQLQSMGGIIVALLSGCLLEASQMILTLPTDAVVTAEIKDRFSKACLSADHIVYA